MDEIAPVIVHTTDDAFTQELTIGEHRLIADEPVAQGGDDKGPNPYDLLMASLGSCTSMTLRLYARRKQWPPIAVTVRLWHRRVHAADCETCETSAGFVDRIEAEIDIVGDVTDEQRATLLTIAKKCPIHRTLTSEIDIRSTLRAR